MDFLGIGAQKAGTTWLFAMLSRHPQVRFPAGKEAHFWDYYLDRGLDWYRGLFEPPAQPGVCQGDITPAYAILERDVIEQVARAFPRVRLIYIIRNPVDRAWSSALMALQRAEMSIDEASDQWFCDHFRSRGSSRRGDYETCIRNWVSVYGSEPLLMLRYESIAREPRALLQRVAAHIGVDEACFAMLSDEELAARVFSGTGQPLRPSLRSVLEEMYRDKVRSLSNYLGLELDWLS